MRVQADAVHKQPVSISIYIYIYIYIENIPFSWIWMWLRYRHVCREQKYVHTRNVYITLITQTHGPTHTHLGISYITATHRKLCSIHVPRLQAYYVCVRDFGHFICFFCFSEPLHVLKAHPFSVPVLLTFAASPSTLPLSAEECCCEAVVDDRSWKKLSIRYFGVSVSFKQSHANLIGPKHFDAFCTNSFKILWLMLVFCLFPVAKMCTITPCGSYPHSTNHPWYMSLDFSSVPLLLLGKIGTNIPILLDEYPHIPKKLSRILES